MSIRHWATLAAIFGAFLLISAPQDGLGQPEPKKDSPFDKKDGPFDKKGPSFDKKDFPFGKGPPMHQTRKILKQFDKNGDGWLNAEERQAARESIKRDGGARPFGKGPGGPGGFGKGVEPGKPGPHVALEDVKTYPADTPLYEPTALRTLFLEFENKDWEAELQDFHGTDVEVPATLTVDGKKYTNVGVHFRGNSSYMLVPAGSKRSLNLSLDLVDTKQRLYGYKTLNLLNSHDDATMMSTVLCSHVARQFIPTPKANFVKVVINGESWGVYVNAQQFNKEFLSENYKTTKGARWKVRGNPGGGGGLDYVGDNLDEYKRHYEIKSTDNDKSWQALVNLCKTLSQTPPEKLEEALKPILDIDGLLWFLAVDMALINCDGYWIRASDYSLYLDDKGRFHVVPHDMNECFRPAQGPGFGGPGGPGGMGMGMGMMGPPPGDILPPPLQGMLRLTDEQRKELAELQKEVDGKLDKILNDEQRKQFKEIRERGPFGFGPGPGGGPGGPGGGPGGPGGPGGAGRGMSLDPLNGLNDPRKPLRSKVLAVPSLREKYLQNVRTIAEKSLDWKNLGPVVAQYRKLIEKEVEADTRKLDSFEAFKRTTADEPAPGVRGRDMPLRLFADERRKYLLDYQPGTEKK